MASCTTSQWVAYAPQAKLEVTISSSTETSATLSWKVYYLTSGYPASCTNEREYVVKIAGETVKTGTFDINGKSGSSYTVASGTKTITKTSSAQSISFGLTFTFNLTWSGVYGGTKSASGSISVPAKTTYTITYNANGGSGAPAKQTKTHGTALTLSSTKPTRSGYTFAGWATSSSGSVAYAAGASYTANADATLYAVWSAGSYTVTYNANGGTGAPAAQTKTYGKALTLSSTVPTRTNYTFKGWGTSASATTVSYAPGSSYAKNANITLYAIWQSSYAKPTISSLTAKKCTSDGTLDNNGTYALVAFSWTTDKAVSSIKIEWQLATATAWDNSIAVSASGTSGSVSKIIGGSLSADNSYRVRATVTDSNGSTYRTISLGGTSFPIDIYYNGKGIAFGKPAELTGYADFGFKTQHRDNAIFDNDHGVYGTSTDGTIMSMAAINTNDNLVIGYTGYSKSIGATNIYGNTLNITTNNGVKLDGRTLSSNKVLWSGGYYMNDTQSCTLSESITSQANGIILIWSEYTDGESVNANFNCTFVPRRFVSSHPGKGVTCFCSSATYNVVAAKYVYISDTTITGYAANDDSASEATCGVLTSPNKFVLRYVIGV